MLAISEVIDIKICNITEPLNVFGFATSLQNTAIGISCEFMAAPAEYKVDLVVS